LLKNVKHDESPVIGTNSTIFIGDPDLFYIFEIMNRRLIIVVVFLTAISLAGILLVQLLWIRDAMEIKKEIYEGNLMDNIRIFRSLDWLLGLSLLLTFVLLITLGITIFVIMRQKKISEIKSDFINNMTHEFKTPIATISLAADAIKNPSVAGNREQVQYYANIIKEENKRMDIQVENVLRMASLEHKDVYLDIRRYDIHDLITQAVNIIGLHVNIRKGEIVLELSAADSSYLVDGNHFVNALLNLLDNSLKYTIGEPRIKIRTENTHDGILVMVKDNGIGMKKEVQKKIFDKFYREQSGDIHDVKGFGLGLSYSREVIRLFNGDIRVESEPGSGSTFIIYLPFPGK
jgi:two-component system phosphate regulon sensor histidine kinase PhoR